MAGKRRPLIAGNWKMNGLMEDGLALARAVAEHVDAEGENLAFDVALAPPTTLLASVAEAIWASAVMVGGQDCHPAEQGAHTGDISAAMLKDAGADFVILGHSERRADHGEADELVRAKTQAARAAGLLPMVCVGESEAERDAGRAEAVVIGQLDGSLPDDCSAENTVVAYEPVWAIGTGRTPTLEEIAEIHAAIRARLEARFGGGARFRLLYGGSVKPANAEAILGLEDVDGALVGGASLKADDFWAIARASA